jgi:transcriptional regulator with XRE-family HTH domain
MPEESPTETALDRGVGDRVRTARRRAELTQKELAQALGVEPITVSRWERGVTTPSLPRLERTARVTGSTLSELVREPEATTARAVELAALREEFAELRALVDRMVQAIGLNRSPRSPN